MILLNDLMIDIETLSTSNNAAILSIGAAQFNKYTGEIGRCFHERVIFSDAMTNGDIDEDTIKWWITQEAEAGVAVTSGTSTLKSLLVSLSRFINSLGNPPAVWGNGATFDITILESAYRRHNIKVPWNYTAARDCRTIEALAEGIITRSDIPREGIHHDALADAKYQAKYISAMCSMLRPARVDKQE